MSQKYYAIVTSLGAAKIANAAALGTKLNITQMAVGDGGGTLPTPNASQTKLVNEKRRAAINTLGIDPANVSQVIAEQVIPETEGGFWIREMGLFDADGSLIAVCNTPETYKPALQEGSGRTQTVRMILIVNSSDAVTLKIDPSVVLATRKYVDDTAITVKSYASDLLAAHIRKNGADFPDAAAFRKNMGLERFVINDTETEVRSPNGKRWLFVTDKEWGCFDTDTQGAVPLTVGLGGTGAANAAEARKNLGLGDVATEDTLPVKKGGTGATDAKTARVNLGIGDAATENVIPLEKGGTGAKNAAEARKNLNLGGFISYDSKVAGDFNQMFSPDLTLSMVVANNGAWGVQRNSDGKTIALSVDRGGTGATTPADARKNLGLGDVATENTLPVSKGGTGATAAAGARQNLELGSAATKSVGTGSGQIPDMSAFPNGTGYTKLPNGKILQWGSASAQASGGRLVNFPVPFSSTQQVSIIVTPKDVAKPNQAAAAIYSNSQFVIAAWDGSNIAVDTELYWYAMGS